MGLNYFLTKRLCRSEGWHSDEFLRRTLAYPLLFVTFLSALKLFCVTYNSLRTQVIAGLGVLLMLALEFKWIGLKLDQLRSEYRWLRVILRPNVQGAQHQRGPSN